MREEISGEAGATDPSNSGEEVEGSNAQLSPDYSDEKMRTAGDALADLYAQRDAGAADLGDPIELARRKMRRGPRLRAGEFLNDGRYRLLRPVGEDASSVRWQAWDRSSSELVNVRVMHARWVTDDAEVAKFLSKAEKLGAWDHPGISRIRESGQSDDGFVYLVTQYFGSNDLEQAAESMDAVDVTQMLLEVAEALGGAHAQDVVHGAVHPANVVLSDDGAAHLNNFDLSGSRSDGGLYEAPEKMQRGYQRSPQADVYSLGMTTMFAVHQSELPFWVLRDPGRLIDGLDCSDALRSVIRKATVWELEERFADAGSMVEPLLGDAALVEALANRALERGRVGVAALHLERLLVLGGQDEAALRHRIGELYRSMDEFEPARAHVHQALVLSTELGGRAALEASEPALTSLVAIAEATKDWRGYAELLLYVADQRPGLVASDLACRAARVFEDPLDDPAMALAAWKQVLTHHQEPEMAKTSLNAQQGLAERLGEWDEYVHVSKALLPYSDEADRPAIAFRIGQALLENLGQPSQGLTWLSQAEAGGIDLMPLADEVELAWANQGDWAKAIEMMMARAAKMGRKTEASKVLLRAGLIATSVHLHELAIRVYSALLERVPDHTVALRHLARIHHRRRENEQAEPLFQQLLTSFKGKNPKEPEASERAADNTAWARILLRQGRGDEAAERLQEALRLSPNLIQALRVAGPLYLDRGEPALAGKTFDQLLVLYRSVDMSRARTKASLGMGDVAWMEGRLTGALGWANRALDVEPDDVQGWWSLARVALSARAGHPGSDRAPWVRAVPKRFTSQEALARLLAGVLSVEGMRSWLGRTGMGRGLVDGGETPMRLACAVVDVLVRYQMLDPDFFERLAGEFPAWQEPTQVVCKLWFGGGREIDLAEAYRWSADQISDDFDPLIARQFVPPPRELGGVRNEDLRAETAWKELMAGDPPPPQRSSEAGESAEGDERAQTLEFHENGDVVAKLDSDDSEVVLERSGISASFRRVGDAVYLSTDTQVMIDGVATHRARIRGGEQLDMGDCALRIQFGGAPVEPVQTYEAPDAVAEQVDAAESETPEQTESKPDTAADEQPPADAESSGDSESDASESDASESDAPVESEPVEVAEGPAADVPDDDAVPSNAEASDEDAAAEAPKEEEKATDSAPEPVASELEVVVPHSVAARLTVPDDSDVPGAEDSADPLALFSSDYTDPDDVHTMVSAPPALPNDSDLNDEAPPSLPGKLVAEISSGPTVADGGAAIIMARMTPPPVERRGDPPAPPVVDRQATPMPGVPAIQMPVSSNPRPGDTLIPDSMGPRSKPMKLGGDLSFVEVMSGPRRGTNTAVDERLRIGAGADADLRLEGDSKLADLHCEVVRSAEKWVLRDLGSPSGTVINGRPVDEVELSGGEVIMVGRTVLRFKV